MGRPRKPKPPTAPNPPMKCRLCERPLPEGAHRNTKFCDDCRRVVAQVRNRAGQWANNGAARRELARTMRIVREVSLEELRSAKVKPEGVSDVRWRIELRRRRNAEWYDVFGDNV